MWGPELQTSLGHVLAFLDSEQWHGIVAVATVILFVIELYAKLPDRWRPDRRKSRQIRQSRLLRGFGLLQRAEKFAQRSSKAIAAGLPGYNKSFGVSAEIYCSLRAIYFVFLVFLGLQLLMRFGPSLGSQEIALYARTYVFINILVGLTLLTLIAHMFGSVLFRMGSGHHNKGASGGSNDDGSSKRSPIRRVQLLLGAMDLDGSDATSRANNPLWRINYLRLELRSRGISAFWVLSGVLAGLSLDVPNGVRELAGLLSI